MTNRLTGNMNLNTVTDLVHLIFVWFEFHLKVNLKAFKDPGVCVVPGGGISRSVVCWTLVLPGRGSKAGTRAENCLFRTKSSSHVLLRPPLVSYSSSSCKTVNHYSCCQISADMLVLFYDPETKQTGGGYYQDLLVFLVLLIVVFVLVIVVVGLREVLLVVQLSQ